MNKDKEIIDIARQVIDDEVEALIGLKDYIDENFEDQKFSVTMTELLQLTSVAVQMANLTNGAITSYTLQIVSTTLI